MRSVSYRGWVLVLSFVLAAGAFAAPRTEGRGVRKVKKIIRSLGDFLTVPTPAPVPPPREP